MSDIVEISSVFRDVFKDWPLPPAPEHEREPPDDWLTNRASRLEWIAVNRARLDLITERAKRHRHIRDAICAALQASGKPAVLLHRGQRVDVPVRDLGQADAIHLADAGALFTHAWALRAYREYDGAVVFIPAAVKKEAKRKALEAQGKARGRGRPSKQDAVRAAYEARFPNGHEIEGLPLKSIAAEIGVEASERTIQRAISEE